MPPTAAEREGIQPVVTLRANGAIRAEVDVGQAVEFTADIEVPSGAGLVVSAEWDFESGPEVMAENPRFQKAHFPSGFGGAPEAAVGERNHFPVSEHFTPAPQLTLTRSHTFTKPGTYFPALRVSSHRDGDGSTPYGRIANLGRVRVVVS